MALILAALLIISSCGDDGLKDIIEIQQDTIPMWPQLGFDGRHSGNPHIDKIRINPVQNGIMEWIDTLNGLFSQNRTVQTIDSKGNIYYLGYGVSQVILKLNSLGQINWTKSSYDISAYTGLSLSADETRLYFGSNTQFVCLDSGGNNIWSLDQPSTNTKPIIGKDGTIFATLQDGMTAINPDGTIKWKYIDADAFINYPSSDIDGNIYFLSGMQLVKLDKNGSFLWSYDTQTNLDYSGAVLIDGFNNVYFLKQNGIVVSLDKKGNFRWQRDSISSQVFPAINSSNCIYTTKGKYVYCSNNDGNLIWSCEILPPVNNEHIEAYLAVDFEDNVYYITEYPLGISTAGSINRFGALRWYCSTIDDPMLGGPVLSPLGKLVFRPKYRPCLISIR